jgi:hypothetical protein
MVSLLESQDEPAKFTLTGESGSGKTGAKASLICAGYKIRSIDTDKGSRLLRALLTDEEHYPYAKWIKQHGIDLNTAYDYIPIDTEMVLRQAIQKNPRGEIVSKEEILAPKSADAWPKIVNLLENWPRYGKVTDWGPDTILDIDTLTSVAQASYYYLQNLNARLGVREDGYSHQQDVGGTQSQLRRMLEKLSSSYVKCHVILNCHIIWIDNSSGYNQSPDERARQGKSIDPKGYPKAVGKALSTDINSKFNDGFTVHQQGAGANVKRFISTVPRDNISAKNSVYLDREYPISTGLAEILAALTYQPKPWDLIQAIRGNELRNDSRDLSPKPAPGPSGVKR